MQRRNGNILTAFVDYNRTWNSMMDNFTNNVTDNNSLLPNASYVYMATMFIIFAFGLVGNVLTIKVFSLKEHRPKAITPFVITLAVADLILVMFGYPVSLITLLSGRPLVKDKPQCIWSAFINGSVGITTIVIFTEMSVIICYTITSMTSSDKTRISIKFRMLLIGFAWVYGMGAMSLPLTGVSSFVPGSARISCAPDWRSQTDESLVYNIGLMLLGFALPLIVIVTSYAKLYRCLSTSLYRTRRFQTAQRLMRRRRSLVKVACAIGVSVIVFVISWSPYCIVCLLAMFQKTYMISNGEAEIPELMAKASVIYNPMVYLSMDRNVRRTLKKLFFCKPWRFEAQNRCEFDGLKQSLRTSCYVVIWKQSEGVSIRTSTGKEHLGSE